MRITPTMQVFLTKLVDYALRFAASILIARFLGPADKGVLTFATLVVSWAVMFGNFSLPDSVIYLIGRGSFSAAEVSVSMAAFSVAAGGIYFVILGLLVHSGILHGPAHEVTVLWLLLLIIPFNLFLENGTAVVRAVNRFRAYNILTVLRSVMFLGAVLLAIWLAPSRLLGIVWATILVSAANAILLLIYLSGLKQGRPHFSPAYLRAALRYGLRGHGRLILANFNLRLDQLVLGVTLNPIHLGYYSVAVSLSELVQMLPDSIVVVLFPRLAGNAAQAAPMSARACRMTVVITSLAAIGLAILAQPLIQLVYGADFLPAANALLLLAPSIVCFSVSKVLWNYVYAVGRPQLTIWSVAAAAGVTAAMIYPMVMHYGIRGAAITSSIAYGVGAIADLLICRRLSALSLREYLVPRREDFTALLKRPPPSS